jgi:hypothetical protein
LDAKPLTSPILQAGLLLWGFAAACWVALWMFDRSQAIACAATLGAFLAAGKVVGIATGLALHGRPWFVGASVLLPDLGTLLVLYPITQRSMTQLGRWNKWVGRAIENARARHQRRDGLIARYGGWGVFAISLAPIGFYSPLVISALGQLAGLRPRSVLPPIGASMTIMTTAWVVALDAGVGKAAKIDPRLPILLTIVLFCLFALRGLIRSLRRKPAATPASIGPAAHAEPPNGPL